MIEIICDECQGKITDNIHICEKCKNAYMSMIEKLEMQLAERENENFKLMDKVMELEKQK